MSEQKNNPSPCPDCGSQNMMLRGAMSGWHLDEFSQQVWMATDTYACVDCGAFVQVDVSPLGGVSPQCN